MRLTPTPSNPLTPCAGRSIDQLTIFSLQCSVLYQTCKRDPPATVTELPPGLQREYILAGPIYLQNTTSNEQQGELDNGGRSEGDEVVMPCRDNGDNDTNTKGEIWEA